MSLSFQLIVTLGIVGQIFADDSSRPPDVSSTLPDDPKAMFVNQPAKGYDSDFAPFMKKMFSGLPGKESISLVQKGPNAGYRPYWYAYNFALGAMEPQKDTNQHQSSHEDWDNGLGRGAGQGLWGGGELSIMHGAGDAVLGAGDLLNRDIDSSEGRKVCYPNLGPTCQLGPPPEDYNGELLAAMRKRTIVCDTCSYKSKPVGLVCTVDNTGKEFLEMDLCVMDKMNCLGGIAYIQSVRYQSYSTYPFRMKRQWARVSIRGLKDADIRMYDRYPWSWGKTSYYIVVDGWPWSGPYSALYRDTAVYEKSGFVWGQYSHAMNKDTFTEYTITWNPQNGWFLMSQARQKDWQDRFHMEYVDTYPRDMKYMDVSAGWAEQPVEFILHELTMLYTGPCKYEKVSNASFPSDTDGVRDHVRSVEDGYHKRFSIAALLKKSSIRPQDLDAQDGSYIEY